MLYATNALTGCAAARPREAAVSIGCTLHAVIVAARVASGPVWISRAVRIRRALFALARSANRLSLRAFQKISGSVANGRVGASPRCTCRPLCRATRPRRVADRHPHAGAVRLALALFLAGIAEGTGDAKIADGVRAGAGRGVACSHGMASIERGADNRVASHALPTLALVGSRALVLVVARATFVRHRVRADAGRSIALAHAVTDIAGRADDRIAPHALAVVAPVGLSARVAVVARASLVSDRVRARPGRRVTDSGQVAEIAGRTALDVSSAARARMTRLSRRAGAPIVARRQIGLRPVVGASADPRRAGQDALAAGFVRQRALLPANAGGAGAGAANVAAATAGPIGGIAILDAYGCPGGT